MRFFGLLVLLTLALGALATHFLLQDNGYVLINFRGWALEMSVPILVLLLILLYAATRALIWLIRTPRRIGEATARASARRAGRHVAEGLVALADGRLSRGERLLTRAAGNSPAPLLNYLTAARAAQMQGDTDRRDNWLRLAYEQEPGAANAVLLTQAELQMASGEREPALASLNRVLEQQPRHPEALKMLARLRHEEGNWQALDELLPRLRKLRGIRAEDLQRWTLDATTGRLAARGLDRAGIDAIWQALPRAMRRHPVLLCARVQALAACGATEEAEAEAARVLRQHWDNELVDLYGRLEPADPQRQLARIERWLRDRPEDPVLLLAAGRACVRNELWGKARSYFESSIAVHPGAAAYGELGNLLMRLGEKSEATDAFRRGLRFEGAVDDRLPRLRADPVPDQG